MKRLAAGLVLLLAFCSTAKAQANIVCRPFDTGGNTLVNPNESIIGNQICRTTDPVKAPVAPVAAAPALCPDAQNFSVWRFS